MTGPDEQPRGDEYPPLEDYPAYLPEETLPPPVYPAPPPYPPPAYPPPPNYPPPQGYSPYYPYPGYLLAKPAGVNGMAIGALVASIGGVACCGLSAVPGLLLGVLAMRETRRTGQDGYGIALAATIIGGLVVAGTLLYFLVLLLGA
ncbi:integral membrane protein [Mycolicibacterium phlei]|uniref:Membrane protein n=1 Tax=Mycolicibacterium phlei DSM 43239 = CCUG 21000 TaxID=1226750 RepID=A0A5N5UR37_MYCPH|nr:DUF4190 domain-containing protein [Mycolicibacterium phlei]VEG10918.1 integral membrane protein [Mycobacteroides chelonae]AMO62818.1 hypothetical protein MPHLCCUG_04030 [Mycolicibacterium phlei]KAB7752066.1 membrane protein [Mycolicibacterium phlei DSM 43239 = CCUG 21000]KXW59469.1 hypothetical protein MPHL43072_12640 [Mycolicibacterium phlei DSM 43072]KXW60664.1 membrane protein [Mycolicibacterium phlei DSM 43239 = CCUG 21000]